MKKKITLNIPAPPTKKSWNKLYMKTSSDIEKHLNHILNEAIADSKKGLTFIKKTFIRYKGK